MARRWRRWNAQQARSVLEELDASGLSVAEFARRRGVHPGRIRRWRARLRPSLQADSPRLVELVPTNVAPRGALRLHCPSGHVIELNEVDLASALRLALAAAAESPS